MTTIYLVRHTSYNEKYRLLPGRLPIELSEKGIKEAEKLRNYLKNKKIEKIYSSAVLRCKQTAEIISDGKIPIAYDLRLLEGLSAYQGYWDPKAWDQFWKHRPMLGGESNANIQKRALDFFETTNFEEGKNYIICSHGDLLYYIYHKVNGALPLPGIGRDEPIKPPNYQQKGSVRMIMKENGKWKVAKTILQEEL